MSSEQQTSEKPVEVNSLRAVIAKCDQEKNKLMNTAALENSRLESTVNSMQAEMNKIATTKEEYETAKSTLDANKKALADSLKKIEDERERAVQTINKNIAKGDQEIIASIQANAKKAADEGISHFTAGKTPEQHAEEEGKKGFQSSTGKEPSSSSSSEKATIDDQKNKQTGK